VFDDAMMMIFLVRRHKKALWIDHHDTISVLAVGKNVLYSGSWDKTIKVWRLADLKCVESIAAHSDAVNALVVDPHRGFLYSGSADGSVKVWERRSKHMIKLPARVSSSSLRHALVSILQPAKVSTINALALAGGGPDATHSSGFILTTLCLQSPSHFLLLRCSQFHRNERGEPDQ
jgi:WD40 repeat protein